MCGIIAGVLKEYDPLVNFAGPGPESDALSARVSMLSSRMRHRGPDEQGVFIGKNFWMGHERLSIVGPSNGHQPIEDAEKTIALVANGEIYNHAQLYETMLGHKTIQRTTASDSEVILHLYKEYGYGCADNLLGMFGFVLVENGGERVMAARDKVGIKPLYMGISHDGAEVLFSSELKGLVDQCRELQLIPAGHLWTRETGLVKYWHPLWDDDAYLERVLANQIKGIPPRYSTAQECKQALETAVLRRFMADVEVGLLLSGGLDSSIIGSIMCKHKDKLKAQTGIKSFAVGQIGSPDILAARKVSEFLGTEHIEIIFTPDMAFDVLEDVIYHMETYEPELIRSSIPNYFLARGAAEHVKVVLTGEGSDELWSGYLYFHDCQDAPLLQMENRRIFKATQFVNLQRADRMTMAHSLEARVPFFDVDYVQTVMTVDPAEKLVDMSRGRCEKYMLRKIYETELCEDVIWRTKAMQCEGVGMNWVETLQKHVESLVSDEEFASRDVTYAINPPHSKEELYYRKIFDKHYAGCDKFIHVWPGGCRAAGAPWKNEAYTRAGLRDTSRLKIGHGCANEIHA